MTPLPLTAFPYKTTDKIRYGDTDRQGHVNNATFLTFLETGRAEILVNPSIPVLDTGASFVIASVTLNFLKEINWPGEVEIGTGVRKIGNSSVKLYQQIFQNGECVATADTVVVQVDDQTGKSRHLTDQGRAKITKWILDQ